ncbi:MAG: ABC transporter permease [Chloroflexi bacterium OHK40]
MPEWMSFAGRKLLRLITLLVAVAIFSYTLISLSPIDPVDAYIGADMLLISPEQRAQIAARWGLDQPPLARFIAWARELAGGNFGTSLIFNRPVLEIIGERFIASLGLMATAWLVSGLLGYALGILAGARPGSLLDRAVRLYAYILASSPSFWVALLLLMAFSVGLRWTPICCASPPGLLPEEVTLAHRLHHLILPAITLSIVGVANMALHTRQKLIEVLESDYALFARAQGATTRDLVRHHGLRNVALPAITLQGASLSELFGGAVLVEQVFTYPGLGEATVQAALRSDVPLLLGIVFFSAIFVFAGNTLADLAYRLVDPRIRIGAATP